MKKQPKPAKVKPADLWTIGTAAFREIHGPPSRPDRWQNVRLLPAQLAGWKAIADWINKNFVRKSLIVLAILPLSVMPVEAAWRTL